LRVVAEQFEAYLVQQLLKSGRAASLGRGLLEGQQSQFYQELHDQQLALAVTRHQGLGVADLLVEQIRGARGESARSTGSVHAGYADRPLSPSSASPLPEPTGAAPGPAPAAAAAGESSDPRRFRNPQEFAHELLPQATEAAAQLGVDPRLLIAQAALETGWGKSIIHGRDGGSSHNLFGIKADAAWEGATVSVESLEFEGGVTVKRVSSFRAYASFEESFRDYVQFLRSNPRYQEALTLTRDPRAFARALQQAGYATDPAYAQKILDIYAMGALSVTQS
jgi:flagellar protein FlgJ